MIRYDLICDNDHSFDGWYRDSAAFDDLKDAGLVACPVCGSVTISKQLMAPNVPAKSSEAEASEQRAVYAGPQDPKQQAMLETIRKLRKHVEANADYVGESFPEEARKMHYGETEERGIYGEASSEEASALLEEGIEVSPLPKLPEDRN